MQQSIVKFYCFVVQTMLNMFRALLCPSSGAPSNCRCSLWFPYECGGGSVLCRGIEHFHLHIHTETRGCNGSLTGLLMMGIIMPEKCWAVSVRQSNKILRLIVASSWVFYLSDWRCTEPQTLTSIASFPIPEHGCRNKNQNVVLFKYLNACTPYVFLRVRKVKQ